MAFGMASGVALYWRRRVFGLVVDMGLCGLFTLSARCLNVALIWWRTDADFGLC